MADPAPTAPPPVPSPLDVIDPGYAAPRAAPQPEKLPDFSPELLARAQSLGISEADAKASGSPEYLDRLVSTFEGNMAAWMRQKTGAPDIRQTPAATPDLDLKLDPAVHEPEVIEAFNRLNQHFSQRLNSLMDHLEINRREQANIHIDRIVEEHGDTLRDLLGAGPGTLANRQAVIDTVEGLRAGYTRRNQPAPDDRTLYQRAVLALHSDRLTLGARSKLAEELTQRAKTYVARPTGKGPADTLSPRDRAVRAVAEKMAMAAVDAGQAQPL